MNIFRRVAEKVTALRAARTPEPQQHPLIAAAAAFVDAAIARDLFCENKIYPAAKAAGITYRRLSKTKRFDRLQGLVTDAVAKDDGKQKAQEKVLQDLAKEAKPFRKFMNGTNARLFDNAIQNYLSFGHNYKGPGITLTMNAFFTEAESYLTQEADQYWKCVRDEIEKIQESLRTQKPKHQKWPSDPHTGPKH